LRQHLLILVMCHKVCGEAGLVTIDPAVVPGLLLVALELVALAAVGYVAVRVVLQQDNDHMALAQGMVIGPALWGLIVNFVLHMLPGLAGALAGWLIVLAIGAWLVWRSTGALQLSPRTLVGFAAVALGLFWIALASRQTLGIPDADTHLGLASALRAGAYPPTFPWLMGQPAAYHHGIALLVALLSPPHGPDLAFVTELLSVYAWVGLVLVVATALLQRASMLVALVSAPLLLTAGAWTLIWTLPEAPVVLQVPVLTGIPTAGIRASLAEIYWPSAPDLTSEIDASPPNIWKPLFVLAYALAFVGLERIVAGLGRSWPAALILAGTVGFLGLLDEPLALMVLVLWALFEAWFLMQARRERFIDWHIVRRSAAGPALAVLLLVVSGGSITDALFGSSESGLSLGWIDNAGSRLPFGTLFARPGEVGLLGIGPVFVAAIAVLLGWRQRLVLGFAVGSGIFLLAALTVQYALAPHDVTRFDGHARNFALLALLVALSGRLAALRPRGRYAAIACIFGLVTWPTVAEPVSDVTRALSRGIHLANAQPEQEEFAHWLRGRHVLTPLSSGRMAAYIRAKTAIDARVLSPNPMAMSVATGRPNASGFSGLLHLKPTIGPEYLDAIRYLEPAAVRRLGFTYVHATDDWISSLPDQARRWLDDPNLFKLLLRHGSDALYYIRPAFIHLGQVPAPQSFEALRQAVPASATVYLPEAHRPVTRTRLASVLAHTRLLGNVDPSTIHLLTDIPTEPLLGRFPDVGVLPRDRLLGVSILAYQPIWWDDESVAYATSASNALAIDPPPQPEADFAVRLSDVRLTAESVAFTVEFHDQASGQWTGQDWLVIEVEDTPWTLPTGYEADGHTHVGVLWFAGQVIPLGGSTTHRYEFDARAKRLSVWSGDGSFDGLPSSGDRLRPGTYLLAARLRKDYLEAAVIPVLKVSVSEMGEASYTVYEGERSASVNVVRERRPAE
jgi:hypothetical protein